MHHDTSQPLTLSTEQLYHAHHAFVARFLIRLGVRAEDLDDAVQEVFLAVHRRGGYERGAAKPTSYLAAIAIHTAQEQRRRVEQRRRRESSYLPEDLPSRERDPSRALETRQELSRVDEALRQLSPSLRDTLLEADGGGESCVAIASASALPLGTVYWRLDRARKRFREVLGQLESRAVGLGALVLGLWQHKASRVKAACCAGTAALTLVALTTRRPATVPEPPSRSASVRPHPSTPVADVPEAPAPVDQSVADTALEVRPDSSAPRRAQRHTPSRIVGITRGSHAVALTSTAAAPVQAQAAPQRPPRAPSEVELLARAMALLDRQPREALALMRALDGREETHYLHEEREYVELMARWALGEHDSLRAQAFLQRYPSSAFARTVRLRTGPQR